MNFYFHPCHLTHLQSSCFSIDSIKPIPLIFSLLSWLLKRNVIWCVTLSRPKTPSSGKILRQADRFRNEGSWKSPWYGWLLAITRAVHEINEETCERAIPSGVVLNRQKAPLNSKILRIADRFRNERIVENLNGTAVYHKGCSRDQREDMQKGHQVCFEKSGAVPRSKMGTFWARALRSKRCPCEDCDTSHLK